MSTRALALVLLFTTALAAAQEPPVAPDVRAVLTKYLKFSSSDLADLGRRIVKHTLPSSAAGEVAVVGAVRIQASKGAFFDRVRDIARFKSGPDVLQVGRFSTPPVIEDLASLIVEQGDFDPHACQPGDCGVRLPAAMIERVRRDGAASQLKAFIFEKTLAYVSGAPDPMPQFDDGPRPIRARNELAGILAAMPEIGALVPSLPEHLRSFPSARVAGADDFLYWSKEKFGIAPFITVTHVTILCPSASTCVMTTRDVYSSRYLDASVALAIATDAGPGAFDLIYDNRSRADALKGAFGGLRRSLTERRARGGLEDSLKAIRSWLEEPAR